MQLPASITYINNNNSLYYILRLKIASDTVSTVAKENVGLSCFKEYVVRAEFGTLSIRSNKVINAAQMLTETKTLRSEADQSQLHCLRNLFW